MGSSPRKVKTVKMLLNNLGLVIHLFKHFNRGCFVATDSPQRLGRLKFRKQTPFEMNQTFLVSL